MRIQKGDTKYWIATPIDTSTNTAVAADSYTATLYDSQQNVITSTLPVTIVNDVHYQIKIDTADLNLDIGNYIVEFAYVINSIHKVKRDTISVVFV